MKNPNFEIRNPNEIRSPKSEIGWQPARSVLECGGPPPLSLSYVRPLPRSFTGANKENRGRFSLRLLRSLLLHPSPMVDWRLALFCLLASALCFRASAQTFAIDWFSVDGGGGTSTGDGYTLTGTTGQPDAGKMSGGGFTLEGGFWSVVSALPTESRPSVGVSLASGVVRIWWPLPATDYVLDQTSSLNGTPVAWKQVPFPYQTNATHISVTVPAPAGTRFYQLRRP